MSETVDRTENIFAAAVVLATAEKRAALLERECVGDQKLRDRVEALLRAHDRAEHLLDRPVQGSPELTRSYISNEQPGTVIAGRYKLLEAIGEGGMGSVWVAEQTEPVRRKVALKLIKAGMDSKSVLARFEAERQALAVMDHPNIAKVLDGGLTETGRPFFVMEYVKGVPITEYCDATRLSIPARLQLFVQVCHALQHAHQKGIIHRDLKPSNILVAPYDDKPVPKVIDFGLAKAMHQSLTERTLHTAHETVLGTPLYMSPEQAQLNNLDVDTRSDIYSLGVLLYELLTGSTPLEKKRFKEAAWDEIRRIIREEEPPRPSTRLSSTDTLPSLAACRHSEAAGLTRLVRGDLDWIVMKSLDKDRTRRYETANSFAADVLRHLSGEAVLAVPPSTVYRIRKFVHRHRAGVLTAASFVLLLLLGVAVSTWQAVVATRAEQAERRARQDAQDKEKLAIEQRSRAERARDRTREVLDAMTSEVTGDALSTQKEISADQKKFLTEVLTYYREFVGEKADDEQSRARTAEAADRVARIEYRLGRKEQGIAVFQMARDAYQTLAADFPNVPEYRRKLAHNHNGLGLLLSEVGKPVKAEEEYRKAVAIFTKLTADFPDTPGYREDLAICQTNLGGVLLNLGKPVAAEEQYRLALVLLEKLATDFPKVSNTRQYMARSHDNLGFLLAGLGKTSQAEEQYLQALAIWKQLAADFPMTPVYRQGLAISHNNLGLLLASLKRYEETLEHDREALAIREKLVADFPAVPAYQIDLGASYCNFGDSLLQSRKVSESLGWFDKAVVTLTSVHRAEPRDVVAKQYLSNSHWNRATVYDGLNKPAEATKEWDRAIELVPQAEQLTHRALRAIARAHAGRAIEAVTEVAELSRSSNWNASQWYDFACVYSSASDKIPDKKQEYADRAMELLRQAVKAGWKDATHMKQDSDLDPLREREDFKRLMADLKGKGK